MRTHDWQASNAPAGPALRLRCACGATLATLPAPITAARARGDGTDTTLCCGACGRTVRLGVQNGSQR